MDPSDNVCIEILRPKTVPDGLIALGTVIQVSEIQVKLQITGGVICLVDRLHISCSYTRALEHAARVFQDGTEPPPRLSQLFKRGQQYVCKIVERAARKGYADAQDIMATLDPSSLQEDNLPKTLLAIPHVPLQCAVQSIEDHGYQMDIGFKGLTGFLTFDEAEAYSAKYNEGEKLFVGQVIRCCLKEAISSAEDIPRVVQLALKKETMALSEFTLEKVSEYMLTERCISPGSRSFLTVMKVQRNGLIVNFMNEFAGFVPINHLKSEWHSIKENYKISDKFPCTVLYFNSITKTFALSIRDPAKTKNALKHFIKKYHIGQIIEKAEVAHLDGIKSVTFKVCKHKAVANVKDALDDDVSAMSKDELHLALDSAFPDGSEHKCRIKSMNFADLILVLSLRKEFLSLSYVSVEELKPADFIEAIVKKYVKDGIIVTFGLNLRAIILNTDLHDYVSPKSYKIYPVGKSIKCRVLKVDLTKQPARVYLTNKEQLMDPDLTIIDSYDRSWKGKGTHATIFKVKPDGLIVELFNNVKGFIPRRFLSSVPIKDVSDLFKVGQVTSCVVYNVNPGRGSLQLGVIPFEQINKMKKDRKLKAKQSKEVTKMSKLDAKLEQKISGYLNTARKVVSGSKKNNQLRRKIKDDERKSIDIGWDSDDSVALINPDDARFKRSRREEETEKSSKRFKFLKTDSGINWSADFVSSRQAIDGESKLGVQSDGEDDNVKSDDDATSSESSDGSHSDTDEENKVQPSIKSRRQRSEEARLREERLREAENRMLDPDRPPQSIPDFERLLLKTPNSGDAWIRYSKFFLDNVETEKARIICRRALKTINFRMEKEKLRVWIHLIKIEAKFGGLERLRETIEEAAQTNDHLRLYQGTAKVLCNCGELDEAQRLYELMLKLDNRSPQVWINYIMFNMDHRKDLDRARAMFEKACKSLMKSDLVVLKSRFAQLEFKYGDAERGKTIFVNLLSDNPRRKDLAKVYADMIRKYTTQSSKDN